MEFTYQGLVRYGFGFDNPNHAAALSAMLIPLLWSIRSSRNCPVWGKVICVAGELLLLAALLATCSRSGILALLSAGIIFWMLAWRYLAWRPDFADYRKVLLELTPAIIAVVMVVILPSGRACLTRLLVGTVNPDDAILNRFKVWNGALRLLADNPAGVGTGNSGYVYTVSLHQGNGLTGYRTMVNSFLTLAVEQGLVIAWITAAVIALAVIAAIIMLHRNHADANSEGQPWFMIGLLAAVTAGIVAGWSSTCFDLSLLSAPAETTNNLMQSILLFTFLLLVGGLLWWSMHSNWVGFKIKLLLGVGCLLGAGIIFCSGFFAENLTAKGSGPRVEVDTHGWLLLPGSNKPKEIIRIYPKSTDPYEVTKILQDVVITLPDYTLAVPLPETSPTILSSNDIVLASTVSSSRTQRLIVYHPEELPPEKLPSSVIMVLLDHDDAAGINRFWQQVAEKHHIPVKFPIRNK